MVLGDLAWCRGEVERDGMPGVPGVHMALRTHPSLGRI